MNSPLTTLSEWFQIAASVGVVIGLIFLIVELNQTQTAIELDIRHQAFNSSIETRRSFLGENPAATFEKACLTPSDLTPEDQIILHNAFTITYMQALRAKIAAEALLSNPSGWRLNVSTEFSEMFRLPQGVTWYRNSKQFFDPDIVSLAEPLLPTALVDCAAELSASFAQPTK